MPSPTGPETDASPPGAPACSPSRHRLLLSAGLVCAVWGIVGAILAWITEASFPNGYVSFAVLSTGWILSMLREGRRGTFCRRADQETPEPEVVGAVYGAIFIMPAAFVMGVMSLVGGAQVDWFALILFLFVVVFGPFVGAALGAFCGNLWKVLVLRPNCSDNTNGSP